MSETVLVELAKLKIAANRPLTEDEWTALTRWALPKVALAQWECGHQNGSLKPKQP